MVKQRTHNEWFRPVELVTLYEDATNVAGQPYRRIAGYGNRRKSCPCCKNKLEEGEHVWAWGEYRYGKWHTLIHFCKGCYQQEVLSNLVHHTAQCGCEIKLVGKGCELPAWLTLEETVEQPVEV